MVYIMAKEYTGMVAAPTEYYFNVIITGYSDNALDLKPLQIAYAECLEEIRLIELIVERFITFITKKENYIILEIMKYCIYMDSVLMD